MHALIQAILNRIKSSLEPKSGYNEIVLAIRINTVAIYR